MNVDIRPAAEEERVAFNEAHHAGGLNAKFVNSDAESLKQTYSGPTGIFETMEQREVLSHIDVVLNVIARHLAGSTLEGSTVLDIGAGTGVFETFFAKAVGAHGRIIACDISQGFVDIMSERFAGAPNVMPLLSTPRSVGQDDAIGPNSVDCVFVCDVYHHLEYPRTTMRQVHRLLRPRRGRLFVIDFYRDPQKMVTHAPQWALDHLRADKDVYVEEIVSCGFRLVEDVDKSSCFKENYLLVFEPIGEVLPATPVQDELPDDIAEDLQRSVTEDAAVFDGSNGSFAARGRGQEELVQSFCDNVEAEFAGMQEPMNSAGIDQPLSPSPEDLVGVKVVKNVPYLQEGPLIIDKHCLDIYVPCGYKVSDGQQKALPVYFHVHGGGWKRGDRSYAFYGAPSVCRFMSKHGGYVSVAPSYRLGAFPYFVRDVAAALKWTIANIHQHGGDPSQLVLSGHSAGGHIIALLMLDPTSYGLSREDLASVHNVVFLSGVYSLYSPLGHRPSNWKNWFFRKRYVAISFGQDANIIDRASPSFVAVALGATLPSSVQVPKKSSCFLSSCFSSSASSAVALPGIALPPTATGSYPQPRVDKRHVVSCRVLVCNASLDGGLEEDGSVFAQLLHSLLPPDSSTASATSSGRRPVVEYKVMAKTNHASICWNQDSLQAVLDFLQK